MTSRPRRATTRHTHAHREATIRRRAAPTRSGVSRELEDLIRAARDDLRECLDQVQSTRDELRVAREADLGARRSALERPQRSERPDCRLAEEIHRHLAVEEDIQRMVESEQRRIGQDLHDEIGQELTAIHFQVHNLRDSLAEADRPETDAVDQIAMRVARLHHRLRAVTRTLVPVQLESHGFRQAVQSLAEDLSSLYEVDVACAIERDDLFEPTDSLVATHLYRIAQEAMTNAVKHGRPRHIGIRLDTVDSGIVLEVSDDGAGLDRTDGSPARLGTRIMRHRARIIGGHLTIEPRPRGGTVVRCLVPAPRAAR